MLWTIQDWLENSTGQNFVSKRGISEPRKVVEMIQDLGEVVYLDFPFEGKAFSW